MFSGTGRGSAILWIMLAAGMGGGYWAWRMIPAYYDALSVDSILQDGSSAARKATRLSEGKREEALREIVNRTRAEVAKRLRHEDPTLKVALDVTGDELKMSADYRVVVEHPGWQRSSTVRFHRTAATHTD